MSGSADLKSNLRPRDQEMLGMGVALETDAHQLANGAAPAVGGDQPGAAVLRHSVRRPAGHAYPVLVLRDPGHLVLEQERGPVDLAEPVVEPADQLELLALQPVGVAGVAGEHRQVELGDPALLPVAELPDRADQPHPDHRVRRAALLQQVERRRVDRRGPVVDHDAGLLLEHGYGKAGARQQIRRHGPDRSAARDQNSVGRLRHVAPSRRRHARILRKAVPRYGPSGLLGMRAKTCNPSP